MADSKANYKFDEETDIFAMDVDQNWKQEKNDRYMS